jgi:arginase
VSDRHDVNIVLATMAAALTALARIPYPKSLCRDPLPWPHSVSPVSGGATFREAHLVMELLHDSRLVSSLDVVELNPFLDVRGRSALVLVDLIGSLFGRQIIERETDPDRSA